MDEKKCWDCARLGKCSLLTVCDNFILFREHVTIEEIALLCGVSESALWRRLARHPDDAFDWIKERCGFTIRKEKKTSTSPAIYRLCPNNGRNAVKWTMALKEAGYDRR